MNKLFTFLICCLTFLVGCEKKKINQMTPTDIVNLYFESKSNGNIDTLREIIDFSSGLPEDEKEKELKALLMGHEAKGMAKLFGVKFIVEYEKIIDESLAEVGVVFKGMNLARTPFDQMELVKRDGAWKIINPLIKPTSEELINRIKMNPKDSSAYYHLSRKVMPDNPAKAYHLFMKYHELEPEGFWISKEYLKRLKRHGNLSTYKQEILLELSGTSESSSRRTSLYILLGQFNMEQKEYIKAKEYFDKAAMELQSKPNPISTEKLSKSKQELKLRLEGKYIDILSSVSPN